VASPTGSRGDAAYARAQAAYQEHSYDDARGWVLEALAQDPQHAAARALLGRIDAVRQRPSSLETTPAGIALPQSWQKEPPAKAPEVISTDPTVLISRASGPVMPEPVEPTVMIQRDDPRRRLPKTETRAALRRRRAPPDGRLPSRPSSSNRSRGRPLPDQERRLAPDPWCSRSGSGSCLAAAVLHHHDGRLQQGVANGLGPPRGMWTPGLQGAIVAVAAVAVAVLVVWGGIRAWQWLWPAGQSLTLDKPWGGRSRGPGCSVERAVPTVRRPVQPARWWSLTRSQITATSSAASLATAPKRAARP